MILVTWPLQKSPSHDLRPSSLLKEKRERRRWTQLEWIDFSPISHLLCRTHWNLFAQVATKKPVARNCAQKYARLSVFN